MAISLLRIKNLRNIKKLEIEPAQQLNMLWGDNGSGKTSVLEAIYTTARGRSFRGKTAGAIITRGETAFEVFAQSRSKEQEHRIGIRKSSSETEVRHNGEKIGKLSELALITPLQIIAPNSHELLERGPEYRRRFLEWGTFHVEPLYQRVHRDYIKALLNRNEALKSSRNQLETWDCRLSEIGERLDSLRRNYLSTFKQSALDEIAFFLPQEHVEITWKPGWEGNERLIDALRLKRQKDLERGFTQVGPHRADLNIKFADRNVRQSASRGQQKLIITAMHIAQAKICEKLTGASPIILIDELAAELDKKNRAILLQRLKDLGSQVFLTGTDPIEEAEIKLFHVEQGASL